MEDTRRPPLEDAADPAAAESEHPGVRGEHERAAVEGDRPQLRRALRRARRAARPGRKSDAAG